MKQPESTQPLDLSNNKKWFHVSFDIAAATLGNAGFDLVGFYLANLQFIPYIYRNKSTSIIDDDFYKQLPDFFKRIGEQLMDELLNHEKKK